MGESHDRVDGEGTTEFVMNIDGASNISGDVSERSEKNHVEKVPSPSVPATTAILKPSESPEDSEFDKSDFDKMSPSLSPSMPIPEAFSQASHTVCSPPNMVAPDWTDIPRIPNFPSGVRQSKTTRSFSDPVLHDHHTTPALRGPETPCDIETASLLSDDVKYDLFPGCGVALALMGFSVNMMFVYVQCASQDIANRFDAARNMPFLLMGTQVLCAVAALCNAIWLNKWKLGPRVGVTFGTFCVGCVLMLIALWSLEGAGGFVTICFGFALFGFQQTLWELIGFSLLQKYPSEAVGWWGVGTGSTGLIMPVSVMLLSLFMDRNPIGLTLCLTQAIITMTSIWFLHHKNKASLARKNATETERLLTGESTRVHYTPVAGRRSTSAAHRWTVLAERSIVGSVSHSLVIQNLESASDSGGSKSLSYSNVKKLLKFGSPTAQLLACTYWSNTIGFTIQIGLAQLITLKPVDDSWMAREAFFILAFGFGFGVLLGRASVSFFQIYNLFVLWIMVLVMLGNACLWLLEIFTHWLLDATGKLGIVILVIHAACNHFLLGAAYSHVLNAVLKKEGIPDHLREPGVNLNFVAQCAGITSATLLSLILTRCINT